MEVRPGRPGPWSNPPTRPLRTSVSEMPANRLPIIGYPLEQTPHEGVLRAALDATRIGLEIEELGAPAARAARGAEGDPRRRRLRGRPHRLAAQGEGSATLRRAVATTLASAARSTSSSAPMAACAATTPMPTASAPASRRSCPKVKGKWPRNAVVLGAGGGARAVVAVLIGAELPARRRAQPAPPQGRGARDPLRAQRPAHGAAGAPVARRDHRGRARARGAARQRQRHRPAGRRVADPGRPGARPTGSSSTSSWRPGARRSWTPRPRRAGPPPTARAPSSPRPP